MVNRDANLFLFGFSEDMWRLTDMTTFTAAEGVGNSTSFVADFDGSNILMGTLSGDGTVTENTVLAYSVDVAGRFVAAETGILVGDHTPGSDDSGDTQDNENDGPVIEGSSADDESSSGGGGGFSYLILLALLLAKVRGSF